MAPLYGYEIRSGSFSVLLSDETKRAWGPTRFARGSLPPDDGTPGSDWLHVAIRARFPKLAAALGDRGFSAMLGAFIAHDPEAYRSLSTTDARLPRYLAESCDAPVWYSELALSLAHTCTCCTRRMSR